MNITKDKDGKHKNPKHRSWYRKGSMNFLRNNNSFRTITSQKLPKGNTKLVSPHHLNVADFGEIMVFENLKHLNFEEIALTKIKRLPDNTFRLQITFLVRRNVFFKIKLLAQIGTCLTMKYLELLKIKP